MTTATSNRITFKQLSPNPLFKKWLEEMYAAAIKSNSRLVPKLNEALESLSKYPIPLQSGAECIILKGFDTMLCTQLDKLIAYYNQLPTMPHSEKTDSDFDSDSVIAYDSPVSEVIDVDNNQQSDISDTSSTNANLNNTSPTTYGVIADIQITIETDQTDTVTNSESSDQNRPSVVKKRKDKSKAKKYKPAHRSGAYAVLLALLEQIKENSSENSLTKEELISKAQKHSEESFVRPKPNTYYTAWSNVARLVTKRLVKKVRNKKEVRYSLSKEGMNLAEELFEDSKNTPTVNDIIFSDAPSTSGVSKQKDIHTVNEGASTSQILNNTINEMQAGSFDIVLLIDKNETSGVSKKNDPTVVQFKKYPQLKHEYRSLKVGDFTWIARHKVNKEVELVLPYIIERKRMDDLGASIKDGRFHEQKFRLRKCGLKNVMYLIENYGNNKHVGLPIQHLMQAIANTRVQDDFKVHMTDSLTNTARFLAMMTKGLTIRYENKNLKSCITQDVTEDCLMTFEYFNKTSAKTKPLTVTETFIKLLLQLKGVSLEKALAITARYKTPRSLIIKYRRCDRNEGENMLANLKYGNLGRNVGPTISKSIYQLFTCRRPINDSELRDRSVQRVLDFQATGA